MQDQYSSTYYLCYMWCSQNILLLHNILLFYLTSTATDHNNPDNHLNSDVASGIIASNRIFSIIRELEGY